MSAAVCFIRRKVRQASQPVPPQTTAWKVDLRRAAHGLNALLEYALGTSDTNNATGPTAYSITREPAGTFLFSHQRVLAADDLTYTLQASTDLTAAWSPADAAFVNSTPVAAGIVSDTWRITPPVGAGKFFVRLRVVR